MEFESLYRQHVQAVFRFAMSITRRRETAEDLTSEAFLARAASPALALVLLSSLPMAVLVLREAERRERVQEPTGKATAVAADVDTTTR